MKDLKLELMNGLKGFVNSETMRVKYHSELPESLKEWYVYTLDGGHCVFVLLKQFESKMSLKTESEYLEWIIPIPVSTVLRGYTVNDDGIIVVKGVDYTSSDGAYINNEDCEFVTSYESETLEVFAKNTLSSIEDIEDHTVFDHHGQVVNTNFFNSTYSEYGAFCLKLKCNRLHLFVPPEHTWSISEIKTAKHVVLTKGTDYLSGKKMFELLFEDFSINPFFLNIDFKQGSKTILTLKEDCHIPIHVHSLTERNLKLKCYIRKGDHYKLPYLKPYKRINNYIGLI